MNSGELSAEDDYLVEVLKYTYIPPPFWILSFLNYGTCIPRRSSYRALRDKLDQVEGEIHQPVKKGELINFILSIDYILSSAVLWFLWIFMNF